jgi:hypothetical protein
MPEGWTRMFKDINLRFDHALGRAEALKRIIGRIEGAAQSGTIAILDDETDWHDAGGEFAVSGLGMTFRGWVKVDDNCADVSLKLPAAARMIASRIAGIVEQEAQLILQDHAREPTPPTAVDTPPPARMAGGERDAVIGVIFGYGWDEVKIWANSLIESGFAGDRVLIVLGAAPEFVERLGEAGFTVVQPGPGERLRVHGGFAPFLVERFQLIAGYLASTDYRNVILTDVRDVVFQDNPSVWLQDHLDGGGLLASSEGVRIGDEWWASHMVENGFGSDALDAVRDRVSRNAGIIAGSREHCRRMCLDIVRLCTQEHETGADQAAYNLILNGEQWKQDVKTVRHDVPWACQAGTVADPRQLPHLRDALLDAEPVFDGTFVRTPRGEPYAIVHQYDRVPRWRETFEARYR